MWSTPTTSTARGCVAAGLNPTDDTSSRHRSAWRPALCAVARSAAAGAQAWRPRRRHQIPRALGVPERPRCADAGDRRHLPLRHQRPDHFLLDARTGKGLTDGSGCAPPPTADRRCSPMAPYITDEDGVTDVVRTGPKVRDRRRTMSQPSSPAISGGPVVRPDGSVPLRRSTQAVGTEVRDAGAVFSPQWPASDGRPRYIRGRSRRPGREPSRRLRRSRTRAKPPATGRDGAVPRPGAGRGGRVHDTWSPTQNVVWKVPVPAAGTRRQWSGAIRSRRRQRGGVDSGVSPQRLDGNWPCPPGPPTGRTTRTADASATVTTDASFGGRGLMAVDMTGKTVRPSAAWTTTTGGRAAAALQEQRHPLSGSACGCVRGRVRGQPVSGCGARRATRRSGWGRPIAIRVGDNDQLIVHGG